MTPQSTDALWEQVSADDESVLDGMIELFETLINLIKSNGYDIPTVRRLNLGGIYVQPNSTLLSLLEPIFSAYCTYLTEHDEIDFNDMINLATQYVQDGKYTNPYKYVIVDEYQDISKARFNLLHSLRKSRDFELFCVGDDWQSIYRFAGSDISFILNFEKYWGATEISKIETTYRFSQKLIEISSGFIIQNPVQIRKNIRGKTDAGFPLGEISGYTEKYAIEFMTKKLDDLPNGSIVFFIGRYSFDAKILNESDRISFCYNNVDGIVKVLYRNRPDLKMSFITAHKSKGLQADYVFIINNKKSRIGFPSKIQDAPILNLLLDNCDQFPHSEERRLFYVALTRAKKKAYLMTTSGKLYMPAPRIVSAICELTGGTEVKIDPNGDVESQINSVLLNNGMIVTEEELDGAITTITGATATTVLFFLPIPGTKVTGGVKAVQLITSTVANICTYKGTPSAIETLEAYMEQYGFKRAFTEGNANVSAAKYYTQIGRVWDPWLNSPYIYKYSNMGDIGKVNINITNSEIIDWCDWKKEESA